MVGKCHLTVLLTHLHIPQQVLWRPSTTYTTGGETVQSTMLGGGAGNANVVNGPKGESVISSISVGLLPNVWGFTVKAPTKNGLDVSGRLGLYTT